MTQEKFNKIKQEHGCHGSWALWGDTFADLSIFEKSLGKLKTNVIFVALNISQKVEKDFVNFHGGQHHTTIRFAKRIKDTFEGTQYEGGYMTDIIKGYIEPDSSKVNIKEIDLDIHKNLFLKELEDLEAPTDTIIIAFGGADFKVLKKMKLTKKYNVVQVMHYSYYGGKDHVNDKVYKKKVTEKLSLKYI